MARGDWPFGELVGDTVGGGPRRPPHRAGRPVTRHARARASMAAPAHKHGRLVSVLEILLGSPEKDPGGVIPTAIYTILPHLYVCAGILTMVVLDNGIAVVSALAWFSAAAIVWVRRYQYRAPFIRSGGRIDLPTVIDEEGEVEGLVQIFWQSSFECGHSMLDAQHRRLFGLGNELVKAVMAKRLPGDIALILDVIIDHVTDHFCAEEAVLAKGRHPVYKEHQSLHRALLEEAQALRDRYGNGEVPNADLVRFFICDVVTEHIAGEALEFTTLWSSRHSRTRRRRRSSRHRR